MTEACCCRFIGLDNEGNVVSYRMNRLPVGTAASPFVLYAVVNHLLDHCVNLDLAERLRHSFYVDDLANSDLFSRAGFNLRKWMFTGNEDSTSVLGYSWNPKSDLISLQTVSINDSPSTLRQLLSTVASLYDPVGFALIQQYSN